MDKKISLILIISLTFILFFSGCVNTVTENGYDLKFGFNENTSLTHEVKVFRVDEFADTTPTRIMKTLTYPEKITEDYAQLEYIVTEAYYAGSGKENEDICASIPKNQKSGTYKFYPSGAIEVAGETKTNFALPSKKVNINDSWEFGGITYTLKREQQFTNQAGTFNVVRINYIGKRGDTAVDGWALFDFENNRIVKQASVEEKLGNVIRIENELVGINNDFRNSTLDLTCVLAEKVSEDPFTIGWKCNVGKPVTDGNCLTLHGYWYNEETDSCEEVRGCSVEWDFGDNYKPFGAGEQQKTACYDLCVKVKPATDFIPSEE